MRWKPPHRGSLIPLTMVSPGERARVDHIEAGRGLNVRLISMGIHAGSEVQVVSKGPPGPFLIATGGTRLAIGPGIARKILVTLVNGGNVD